MENAFGIGFIGDDLPTYAKPSATALTLSSEGVGSAPGTASAQQTVVRYIRQRFDACSFMSFARPHSSFYLLLLLAGCANAPSPCRQSGPPEPEPARTESDAEPLELDAVGSVATFSVSDGSAWPQTGYSRSRSRANSRELTINASNVASLEFKYRTVPVPTGVPAVVEPCPEPIIANERLYAAECRGFGRSVSAYNLADGTLLGTVSGTSGDIAFAYGSVFLASASNQASFLNGTLTRWSPDLSKQTWSATTAMSGEFSNGVVLAADGRATLLWDGALKFYDGHVRGTAEAASRIGWTDETGYLASRALAYSGGKIYVTSGMAMNKIQAYDVQCADWNCQPTASATIPGLSEHILAAASGSIVTVVGHNLVALDASDLAEKWHAPFTTTIQNNAPIAISAGRVFVSTYDESIGRIRLRALSLKTGATLWQSVPLANLGSLPIAPSVGGDVVYVVSGTSPKRLFAFATTCATASGECSPLLEIVLGTVSSPPVIAAGRIAVTGLGGVDVFGLP